MSNELESPDHIGELFSRLDDMQKSAGVNTVFGPSLVAGDTTTIPIATVTFGFGLGFGEGHPGSGGGGGGGAVTRPLGVARIASEGVHIEPVMDEQMIAIAGMLLVAWAIFWVARTIIRIFSR